MSWRCSDCNLLIESSGPVDESGNPILEDWYVTVYVIETDGEEEWSNYVVGAPATDLLSLIST